MKPFLAFTCSFALAAAFHVAGFAQPPEHDRMPISPAPQPLDPNLEHALATGPRGTLAIRALQGTKGGPDIGVADVQLELFHRNQSVRQLTARLDERGMVIIQDVPVAVSLRPVVRIQYANATYQEVGPTMDAAHPTASMEVKVYEITDTTPAWRVTQRHVLIAPIPGELDIVENVEVENPTDHTWMGAPADPADPQARRTTVAFILPQGAANVQLEFGFHGWCCTTLQGNVLMVQMPLMPGKSPFRYTYRVPTPSDEADVQVAAPALCDSVSFLIPDDQMPVKPTGLEPAGTQMVGQMRVRDFRARTVGIATPVGLHLSGLLTVAQTPPPAQTATSAPASTDATTAAQSRAPGGSFPTKIAIGVALLILGGAALLVLRPPGEKARTSRPKDAA